MADVKLRMKMDASEVKVATTEAKSTIDGFKTHLTSTLTEGIGKWFALGAAASAAMATIKVVGGAMKDAIEEGGKISDLSKRLEIDPSTLQEFAFAAKKGGTDVEQLAEKFEKLKRSLADTDTNPAIVKSMTRLGISAGAIMSKDAMRAFRELGAGMESIAPSAQKTDDLFNILGKSSGEMVVTLKELSSNSAAFQKGFFNIKDDDIAKLKEASEAIEDFQLKFKSDWAKLTVDTIKLGSAISDMSGKLMDYLNMRNLLTGQHYKGEFEQLSLIYKLQSDLQIKKQNKPEEEEQKKNLKAKEEAAALKKKEEAETKSKDKVWADIEKIKKANSDIGITDEQHLKNLEAEQTALENQLKQVEKLPQTKWSLQNVEDLKRVEEIKGEKSKLQLDMGKKFADKNKLDISSDSAVGIGNLLGSNLNSKMLSIGEETNKLLRVIEANTRSRAESLNSPFTA